MSQERRPSSDVAILLGGGVREALMAQSVLRACAGATGFVSADAIGAVLGIRSVGRGSVFDDAGGELLRVFRRLRTGAVGTVIIPYPARYRHLVLAYFAAVPRRLVAAGAHDWVATERSRTTTDLHPVE